MRAHPAASPPRPAPGYEGACRRPPAAPPGPRAPGARRRAALATLAALGACAPAVVTAPALDDDLDGSRAHVRPAVAAPAPVPVAPPGPGLRQGTIARAALTAVLDAGPPGLLRQLEVTAQLEGSRFVGWQLVQLLDRASPLAAADLAPGDVLLSVNGQPLSRPDELMALWDGLRGANELVAELRRGAARVELRFAIDPPVSAPPPRTSAPPRR